MSKWIFSYSLIDGRAGHFKVTAASKIDAIKKGVERARKSGESVARFDCKLTQP